MVFRASEGIRRSHSLVFRLSRALTGCPALIAVILWTAAATTPAQVGGVDFGPWNAHITPTSSTTHASFATAASTANGKGIAVPAVQGSPGSTTIGGVPTFEFSGSDLPNNNQAGLSGVTGSSQAIALNANVWGNLQPPIDAKTLVQFAATIYHELAHIVYQQHYTTWCAENPTACSSWKSCIAGLQNSDGTSKGYNVDEGRNPCDEAYANAGEYSKLCQDKHTICQDGDLTADEKASLIAQLDAALSTAKSECEQKNSDCNACPGGPGMPAGFQGCPTGSCDCPEED